MDFNQDIKSEDLQKTATNLEELSRQLINILTEHKKKGLLDEEEFQKHIETKKNFLIYRKSAQENED